jgi:hypothetical protein
MSKNGDHRPFDRGAAEQLLTGDPAVRHAYPALGAVLAAASAPAPGRHLAGEDAAVAAFAAAHLPSPRSRRIQMLKTTLAKLLTVKVAACVAALGAGGVAVAASTGTLPGPLHHAPAKHHAPASASAFPSHSPRTHPSGTPSAWPSGRPSPSDLAKLCVKWTARPGDERGNALDEPEFGDLVKEAGRKDRDRVDNFCNDLKKIKPSGTPSGTPSAHPSGSVRPSGSGNPGPRQADLPSGTPNSTRSGR